LGTVGERRRELARQRWRRLALACAVATLAITALPAPAPAAVTCNYSSAFKALGVSADAGGGQPHMTRNGSAINYLSLTQCGAATVNNTNKIFITIADGAPADSIPIIDLSGGPFEPGYTAEAASSEIEFQVTHQGSGANDLMDISGGVNDENIRLGTNGINLNAGEIAGIDVDVTTTGIEQVQVLGSPGPDVISGAGGSVEGSPSNLRLDIQDGNFDAVSDQLTGGAMDDFLSQNGGADQLRGGDGDDFLAAFGQDDADTLDGQGGSSDTLGYSGESVDPVRVDLRISGPQDTGAAGTDTISGIENIIGTSGPDRFTGDTATNVLQGGFGPDTLDGASADDELWGYRQDQPLPGDVGDTASYASDSTGAVVDLRDGAGSSGEGDDILRDIENATGSDSGDVLKGNGAQNVLTGRAGGDTLVGRAGKDGYAAGGGNDTVNSADGTRERVSCGGGNNDHARADANDNLDGCEDVNRV
jgi:Ca2+-binding RTX toxin-like protein